jgi:hypothetical protein
MTITTIYGAIRAVLMANSGVSALVGSRIYTLKLPDACTFPAISIHKISDPFSRIKGSPRVQVSVWGKDPLVLEGIKAAVETALDGYAGTQGNFSIVQITPLESHDLPPDDTGLYHIAYDFQVLYKK